MRNIPVVMFLFIQLNAYSQNDNKHLNVELRVTATTTHKEFNGDNELIRKTETQSNYTVGQVLLFNADLLKRILSGTQKLEYCNGTGCMLLTGDNEVPENIAAKINKETYSVLYSYENSTWTKCDDTLRLTAVSKASGNVDHNYIITQVFALQSPYKNGKFPYYELSVSIGCGFAHYPITSGTIKEGKTYNCDTKKWSDDTPNQFELCVNNLHTVHQNGITPGVTEEYTAPLFDEGELTSFLKAAPGNKFAKTFELKAKEYHKDASFEEQTDIKYTLIFKGTWQPGGE